MEAQQLKYYCVIMIIHTWLKGKNIYLGFDVSSFHELASSNIIRCNDDVRLQTQTFTCSECTLSSCCLVPCSKGPLPYIYKGQWMTFTDLLQYQQVEWKFSERQRALPFIYRTRSFLQCILLDVRRSWIYLSSIFVVKFQDHIDPALGVVWVWVAPHLMEKFPHGLSSSTRFVQAF